MALPGVVSSGNCRLFPGRHLLDFNGKIWLAIDSLPRPMSEVRQVQTIFFQRLPFKYGHALEKQMAESVKMKLSCPLCYLCHGFRWSLESNQPFSIFPKESLLLSVRDITHELIHAYQNNRIFLPDVCRNSISELPVRTQSKSRKIPIITIYLPTNRLHTLPNLISTIIWVALQVVIRIVKGGTIKSRRWRWVRGRIRLL